ncbi:MAG: S8 family serine peptidase [Caldilineaceae bacterium]|nr:S8 family serine peptidase [Caldilineaceae bacterium]
MTRTSDFSTFVVTWLSVLTAVVSLLFTTPRAALAAPDSQDVPQNETGQTLLVHFDPGTTPEMRDALIAQTGGELVRWMQPIHVAEIRLPVQEGVSVASLPLLANESVTFVEPDSQAVSGAYVPNDPDLNIEALSYGLRDVQALEAWDIVTGSQEIVIAVVDSGINADHPEFAGRVVAGYDFVDRDELPEDVQGHGTYIAGVIAAAFDNGQGVAGVCPNCSIMPVKVLDDINRGSWSQLAEGILFAVDQGAQIINLSLVTIRSETVAAAIEHAVQSGVVVVAAAGNVASDEDHYPAAYEGVIGVGATNSKGLLWEKSNFGKNVDLTAPGEVIYSTWHDLNNAYFGYTYASGTSVAAAYVSGVAGLLLSVEPSLTAEEVTEAMILGADDLGAEGRDDLFGHGRVNALGALMSPVRGLSEVVVVDEPHPNKPVHEVVMFLPALSNQ